VSWPRHAPRMPPSLQGSLVHGPRRGCVCKSPPRPPCFFMRLPRFKSLCWGSQHHFLDRRTEAAKKEAPHRGPSFGQKRNRGLAAGWQAISAPRSFDDGLGWAAYLTWRVRFLGRSTRKYLSMNAPRRPWSGAPPKPDISLHCRRNGSGAYRDDAGRAQQ